MPKAHLNNRDLIAPYRQAVIESDDLQLKYPKLPAMIRAHLIWVTSWGTENFFKQSPEELRHGTKLRVMQPFSIPRRSLENPPTYLFLGTTAQASISTSMSGKSIPTPLSKVAGLGCCRKSGSCSSKNLYISSRISKTSSLRFK